MMSDNFNKEFFFIFFFTFFPKIFDTLFGGIPSPGLLKSIFFKEDTQVNTASHNYTGNSIDGETFKAGQTIFGLFTSITLTSGACIAYKI